MNICILYGGRSGEHEVSLRSAASVIKNLDPSKYRVTAIGIDKAGRWHLQEAIVSTLLPGQGDTLSIVPSRHPVSIVPSDGIHAASGGLDIDCVFPVLHGIFGDDGTIQGLLETAGLAYVGAGVLGSAASMDKVTAKRLWRDAGLPIVDIAVLHRARTTEERAAAGARLGWPLFVKPCSAGSSLGASRIMPAKGKGFGQSYNVQAAVDTQSLLVVATDIAQVATDKQQLEPMPEMLAGLPEALGRVAHLLADNGYFSAGNVERCVAAKIEPLHAAGRDGHHPHWEDRFTEPPALTEPASNVDRMKHRLKMLQGRKLYGLRKQTVEPVFGIIKAVMRFRQFLLRGLAAVRGEWSLVTMAWNIKRMAIMVR